MSFTEIIDQNKKISAKIEELNLGIRNLNDAKNDLYMLRDENLKKLMEICDHKWEFYSSGIPCGPTTWKCYKCGNYK